MVWIISEPRERKRGRKPGTKMPRRGPLGAAAAPPMTATERKRRSRSKQARERIENIAILDFETDPFDACQELIIKPFLAVLYTEQYGEAVIWEENENAFTEKVVAAIEGLPGKFTVYAHNGGRFDFMFLLYRLRGKISFKGRGIMSARIGPHELRDSFHIVPERLANWQKDKFDYDKLKAEVRKTHEKEIIAYCISDCHYLLDIVRAAVDRFGLKLTIGQMAMAELRKFYDVPKFDEGFDGYMRQYFFGGRVECVRGRGEFCGNFKLYDVNSLYPSVMANFKHPVGSPADYKMRYGQPGPDTVFIDLECRNNGALIAKTASGETTARIEQGRFRTTIWEYETAIKYGLISDVKFNLIIDCAKRTDFSQFVLPLYENRQRTKAEMDRLKTLHMETTSAFLDLKKDDMFYKFLLNNAYGKFALNPRNFMEYWITDPDEQPPDNWFKSIKAIPDGDPKKPGYLMPTFESERYWLWHKPAPSFRFNNLGVAASITGAARAVLLEALQHATDAIYCDTDSIICRALSGVAVSRTELGAWDLEDQFTRVIINGKKLYAVEHLEEKRRTPEQIAEGMDPRYTVKSKGTARINWSEMDCMLHGAAFQMRNRAPTLDRFGDQYYVKRTIRATAPIMQGMQI